MGVMNNSLWPGFGQVGRVFANCPETGVQSQVESYQRLTKWYLIPPCLTNDIIRYVSRVKWSNPGKGVAPPLHLGVVAMKREPSGCPRLQSPTLLYYIYIYGGSKVAIIFTVYLNCQSRSIKCIMPHSADQLGIFSHLILISNPFSLFWVKIIFSYSQYL